MTMKILRLPEVIALTGLSKSSIYSRIQKGLFPKQINLGGRAVGWLQNDIDQWFDGLINCGQGV